MNDNMIKNMKKTLAQADGFFHDRDKPALSVEMCDARQLVEGEPANEKIEIAINALDIYAVWLGELGFSASNITVRTLIEELRESISLDQSE